MENIFCRSENDPILLLDICFLVVLNISVLVWIIVEWGERDPGILALEIIINLALVLEISFNRIVEGEEFWKDWFNRVDVVICVLCLIALVIMFVEYAQDEDLGYGSSIT
eukprot:UN00294